MNFSVDIGIMVSAGIGILVFYLTKWKERESERRQFKIERYAQMLNYLRLFLYPRDMMTGIPEEVFGLAQSVNEVALMAGPNVMKAMDALFKASAEASTGSAQSEDENAKSLVRFLDDLVLAMRDDIEPGSAKGLTSLAIPLMMPRRMRK